MNKVALEYVANAIENHTIPDLGFNISNFVMRDWLVKDRSGHGCPTTACIGGWAVALLNEDGTPRTVPWTAKELFDYSYKNSIREAAERSLNISRKQGLDISSGDSAGLFDPSYDDDSVEASVARIRKFISEG